MKALHLEIPKWMFFPWTYRKICLKKENWRFRILYVFRSNVTVKVEVLPLHLFTSINQIYCKILRRFNNNETVLILCFENSNQIYGPKISNLDNDVHVSWRGPDIVWIPSKCIIKIGQYRWESSGWSAHFLNIHFIRQIVWNDSVFWERKSFLTLL